MANPPNEQQMMQQILQGQGGNPYQPQMPRQDMMRMNFKPEQFDLLIKQQGYTVVWEQGMLCSCYQPSGQPDMNCSTCRGKGYVYFGATKTKAVVASINGHKEQVNMGLYDFGSAYLTPLSTDNVGFRDRFTFVDFTTKFSQVINRGANGVTDELRYPSLGIICIRVLDVVFTEGKDFTVTPDGTGINWLTSSVPQGTNYSVLYNVRPVYIAINPIHELRGTYTMYHGKGGELFAQLPKQFQIKREDFLD